MGKRWTGGGGRRPVLDLSTPLNASNAAAAADPPTRAPPGDAGAAVNPLLGLIGYDDDDEKGERVAISHSTQSAEATSAVPSMWQRILDPGSNAYYFWNPATNEVRWTAPESDAACTIGTAEVMAATVAPGACSAPAAPSDHSGSALLPSATV